MTSLGTWYLSLDIRTWFTPDSMTPFIRFLYARQLAVDGAGWVVWYYLVLAEAPKLVLLSSTAIVTLLYLVISLPTTIESTFGECLFQSNCISSTNFAIFCTEATINAGPTAVGSGKFGRLLDNQTKAAHLFITFNFFVEQS
jgi:hypothetical protein